MKKLITSVAVILAAFAVNAAAINWSATGVGTSQGTALTGAGQYMAYFFATSDSSQQLTIVDYASTIEAISSGHAADVIGKASYSKANTYVSGSQTASFASNGNGSFAAGTTVSGFVVILDNTDSAKANWYMVASNGSEILTKTAASTGNMAFSYASQASNTWAEIAPEPTSGLMMLLGMGVLALRRRRA